MFNLLRMAFLGVVEKAVAWAPKLEVLSNNRLISAVASLGIVGGLMRPSASGCNVSEEKITNPDGSTSTKRSVSGCSTQEAQEQFAALRDQSSTAPASVPSPISTANAAEVEGQTQGKNVAPKANEGGKKTPDATGDKTVPKCRVQLKAVGTDVNLKTDTGCDVSVHVSAPPSKVKKIIQKQHLQAVPVH